ncbi:MULTISPECIES: hypothetical protein [Stenotrophomonas]|jgi:hypothetical protein|uniref:Uncharacterized protein n=1 Tax=Stenotrophomonas maltophilia TaxID=40324 RepID=A0A4S2CUI2_STEMA|nr:MULTISPECIES: hypothetical protein [Stenotrophomonas]MBD3825979.1 hypothetical protein [Stenotrophomonas sp.]TGY32568.1 hypothetical protein E5352_15410 [Stenotrophomonas maltophilia]
MQYGAHGLAEGVRTELEASYVKHGCGPEFWTTYQRVLDRLVPQGTSRTRVTNELALIIEQLGIVRRAQMVPPRSPGRPRAR